MDNQRKINVGIGFVTGRKNFRKVLKTYVFKWKHASTLLKDRTNLHLFVAYDLEYNNTQANDYVNIRPEVLDVLDSAFFISKSMIHNEITNIVNQNIADEKDASLLFERGYAGKRNAILYYALKNNIDYLIFLDDDEYPLAVTKTRDIPLWSGQDVFTNHLQYLKNADMTIGSHCGYISPIPSFSFNDALSETDFRIFIEAISNDILNWDTIKRTMENGGVTYAVPQVLIDNAAHEVPEINRAKFVSGSNLGINLTNPSRVKPFFNPPKARGEDTFLSTCLSEHTVMQIPCYTFHDGFAVYSDLLDGVLPLRLKHITTDNEKNVTRFYNACIGWIRYKPLFVYITRPEDFEREMEVVRTKLTDTIPKLCAYFGNPTFKKILTEFDQYRKAVPLHHQLFLKNQRIWEAIRDHAVDQRY